MAFCRRGPLAYEIAGDDNTGPPHTRSTMDGYPPVLLVCPLDGGNTSIELLLIRGRHVRDRLVDDHEAGVIHPVASQPILGEREQ